MIRTDKPLLSIRKVCVDYVTEHGNARAVNEVSFDIYPGETVGLAGESGCGKSTLAFAIANLHEAPALISEGEILFEGRDILKMSSTQLRDFRWNETSMVFQSAMNSLNPVLKISEQIIDVILAHKKVSKEEAWTRGAELLSTVGIHPSRMDSYPHQLSGGMRQRVVIAIALALRPKLIVMDEPTTALDVVVERDIMDELFELKEKFGFAILFISHDLGLMGEIADRIGIMYAGKLVEMADAAQILEQPQHPYTRGLVGSFPTIHGPRVRLEGIPGNPLNLLETPEGCYFQARCSDCIDKCLTQQPKLTQSAQAGERDRLVACHVATDLEVPA
ncbi:MAG: ABC transporter ATP-binding protein [Reinekea forsetii]|jgi:peptide/nickel transport system ATP-binding protein|uniref:ABC-type dipeptide transporter n=2 Tax=Reinekea TaxID=230494 RepID=A0A2K8KR21_9GAMM|nr:ABC transporter ATP-binding protein [Reinekea forsetii]ATX76509.1 oligopeptide ABC transporter, ATP-binding protein OppD [Reinekea forsetii]MDO7641368.1 ABC transporter ATP-binding protein [Reinekea forsetii]MDO7643101.1 ABC transporter ATP-binding protein [Reinekea forsetii]MDO7675136.1 ABC transporter ATP-binding protein [Reinekea forsetii]